MGKAKARTRNVASRKSRAKNLGREIQAFATCNGTTKTILADQPQNSKPKDVAVSTVTANKSKKNPQMAQELQVLLSGTEYSSSSTLEVIRILDSVKEKQGETALHEQCCLVVLHFLSWINDSGNDCENVECGIWNIGMLAEAFRGAGIFVKSTGGNLHRQVPLSIMLAVRKHPTNMNIKRASADALSCLLLTDCCGEVFRYGGAELVVLNLIFDLKETANLIYHGYIDRPHEYQAEALVQAGLTKAVANFIRNYPNEPNLHAHLFTALLPVVGVEKNYQEFLDLIPRIGSALDKLDDIPLLSKTLKCLQHALERYQGDGAFEFFEVDVVLSLIDRFPSSGLILGPCLRIVSDCSIEWLPNESSESRISGRILVDLLDEVCPKIILIMRQNMENQSLLLPATDFFHDLAYFVAERPWTYEVVAIMQDVMDVCPDDPNIWLLAMRLCRVNWPFYEDSSTLSPKDKPTQRVVEALKLEPGDNACDAGLQMLKHWVTEHKSADTLEGLVKSDGIAVVVRLLKRYEGHEKMQSRAYSILSEVVSRSDVDYQAFIELDVFSSIASTLRRYNKRDQREVICSCCNLLACLTLPKDPKVLEAADHAGCFDPVFDAVLLFQDDGDIFHPAGCSALRIKFRLDKCISEM